MVHPTQQQARALADLRGNTDVKSFLQACLDDIKNRLVTVAGAEDFRVLQGQAQSYQNMLNQIDGTTRSGKR